MLDAACITGNPIVEKAGSRSTTMKSRYDVDKGERRVLMVLVELMNQIKTQWNSRRSESGSGPGNWGNLSGNCIVTMTTATGPGPKR